MDLGEEEEVIEEEPAWTVPTEWPADAPEEPLTKPEAEPVPA